MLLVRISATEHNAYIDGKPHNLCGVDKKKRQQIINAVKDILWPRERNDG